MLHGPLCRCASSAAPAAKPTVVVIGTGWAGARVVRDLDLTKHNVIVLSQRNHMVFTPLLPQTCTGTLEFRSICDPITRINRGLSHRPNSFYRTMVYDVDFDSKNVHCMAVAPSDAHDAPVKSFDYHYDQLVLAHGARASTFNIPGVEDHVFFLREITEARGIRRRLVQNIMTARLPVTTAEEKRRLLHVVVVGGGPTGVEFAADLADFLHDDIPKLDKDIAPFFTVTLVEANEILGMFDFNLRNYGAKRLQKMGVKLRKAVVAGVSSEGVKLADGEVLACGLIVWSTGVGPSNLTRQLLCDKTPQGRISIDDHLRVLKNKKPVDGVYALGDCAANSESPLPTLAAVASQQGKYLAAVFNGRRNGAFNYRPLGSMVSLGHQTALCDFKQVHFDLKGFYAYLVWRSAYFTMLGTFRTRLYTAINWLTTFLLGRDMTYIAEISESKLWNNLAREGASKEQARLQLLQKAKELNQGVVNLPGAQPAQPPTTPAPESSPK